MHTWSFQFIENPETIPDDIVEQIHRTFLDGFGLQNGWSITGIRNALHRSTIMGLLVTEGQQSQITGYALYSVPHNKLDDTYVLWEDAICLRKCAQGQGLASLSILLKYIKPLLRSQKLGWVGGRTQNPLVFLRYARLGKIFPFDITYASDEGRVVMDFLLQNIAEVSEVQTVLEYDTGICRQVYHEGRLGDYLSETEGTERFEKLLNEWEFDRTAGDAVITATKLAHPI